MTKRKKVGEEAVKRLANPDTKQGIIDTQREADKDYFPELEKCIANHSHWDTPFYVVVHMKKEKLLENVIRRYFIARLSMPTPQWDQTLWRYDPKTTDLRFVWTLPDSETAKWMASHPQELSEHHRELVEFILAFLDKRLYSKYYHEFNKGNEECGLSESFCSDSPSPAAQVISSAEPEEESAGKPCKISSLDWD